jgi:ComF family protein
MGWKRVDEILELLFPTRCVLCGQFTADGHAAGSSPASPACAGCLADLPWLPRTDQPPAPGLAALDDVRSALSYEYPVDSLVAAAKFGRQVPVARALGLLLAHRVAGPEEPPDAVVPVPLHWRREAGRGFNQAEEIARAVCEVWGWTLRPDLCRRVRPTREQSGLRAAQRRDNLEGAFALADAGAAAACRHVLIVDDVLTTGATVGAVATIFRRAGVRRLSAWTVAKTPARAQATARNV